ncbi:MAG: hypothetical protein ACAH88_14415, partial [Roseimicrobium sp.]
SRSGILWANKEGHLTKAGSTLANSSPNARHMAMSPCGRYVLRRLHDAVDDVFDVWSTEAGKPLMKLARMPMLEGDRNTFSGPEKRLFFFGPEGPIGVLDSSRRNLQIIELNVPQLARRLKPEDVHVISQPPIHIAEGEELKYLIETNNPEQVKAITLREPVEGAALGADGILRYQAPVKISTPTQIHLGVEILCKNGTKLLHEISLRVLAAPKEGSTNAPQEKKPAI